MQRRTETLDRACPIAARETGPGITNYRGSRWSEVPRCSMDRPLHKSQKQEALLQVRHIGSQDERINAQERKIESRLQRRSLSWRH